MIVLHVINSLGLSGGAEQQLEANITRFADSRIEHHVAHLYQFDEVSRRDEIAGSASVTWVNPNTHGSQPHWRNTIGLTRLIKKLRPNLIHSTLADANLASRLAGRITSTPVLESLVNISHEPVRMVDNPAVRPWKLAAWRRLDRATMGSVARFHALSNEVARSWIDTVGVDPAKIEVIPRGIDFDRVAADMLLPPARESLRTEIGIGSDERVLLMVGRQEPQKGHLLAVQAMRSVLEEVPGARLVLVGRTGNSTIRIRDAIAALGLEGHVIELGSRTDVGRLMAAADLLLFPSLFEGLGVSLLESMAHGLTPIVLDRPPMNEVVTPEIGFVAASDGHDLGATILRALEDIERVGRMGKAAADVARQKYDLAVTVRRTENLYRRLLGLTP